MPTHDREITKQFFRDFITQHPRDKVCDLSYNCLEDDKLPTINLHGSTIINLSNNYITDLSKIDLSLAIGLNLAYNYLKDDAISTICQLPSLQYLDLSGNQITEVGIQELILSLGKLKHVYIFDNPIGSQWIDFGPFYEKRIPFNHYTYESDQSMYQLQIEMQLKK